MMETFPKKERNKCWLSLIAKRKIACSFFLEKFIEKVFFYFKWVMRKIETKTQELRKTSPAPVGPLLLLVRALAGFFLKKSCQPIMLFPHGL